jgi:hypothetical protein
MTTLVERIIAIAASLDGAGVDWALGGALALAYATEEPRATRDIDVNVFVPATGADDVFAALPPGVAHGPGDRQAALADDQVRLWWEGTPVDLFFATGPFHYDVARRCRAVPFAGHTVRVLAPDDLAVFKALFDRPRDWVDIDAMAACGSLDPVAAAGALASVVGGDDPRVGRLAATGTAGNPR